MWATWFDIQILSHLPKQCICMLDMILTTNYNFFSKQHSLGGFRNVVWLLCKELNNYAYMSF
jgi:hypothetical protein